MKTWEIRVYYGNENPFYVKMNKIDKWRNILREKGFVNKEVSQFNQTIRWLVTHPTNEYALEELILLHGDELLPATTKEIENV